MLIPHIRGPEQPLVVRKPHLNPPEQTRMENPHIHGPEQPLDVQKPHLRLQRKNSHANSAHPRGRTA